MINNKKANFLDMFGLIEVLAVIAFFGLFTFIIMNNIADGFIAQPDSVIPGNQSQTMRDVADRYPFWIDLMFSGSLIGIFAFSIFAARLIPSSPKMIFVALVFLVGGAFLGKIIEQVWYPFTQHTMLSPYINQLTITPFILDNFMIVLIIFITSVAISLLSKEEITPQ